jgi:hypothetical protein
MVEVQRFGNQVLCMMPGIKDEIECMCFDGETCDIHINDGGNLICRHGSNEGVINGIATVICPLEIDRERKKWDKFLKDEMKPQTHPMPA